MPTLDPRARAILVCLVLVVGGWMLIDTVIAYRSVPPRAGVGRVVYKQGQAFGFGPGGNEAGVIVFSISHKTADALEKDALSFLHDLPVSRGCSSYREWHETPVAGGIAGEGVTSVNQATTFDGYLNRYGFGFDLPPNLQRMLDRAFVETGSYYALGGCGGDLFIFMPGEYRAAFVYSG